MAAQPPAPTYTLPPTLPAHGHGHAQRETWRSHLTPFHAHSSPTPSLPRPSPPPGAQPVDRTPTRQSAQEWYRTHLFRGMLLDIRRRLPYYGSDWTDAWDYRVVPATVYMYFAK